MSSKTQIVRSLLVLVCLALLSACSTGAAQTGPTPDVESTLSAARTQAAMTVAAQIANQATATPLPATATLAPTATDLPTATQIVATNTPLPSPTVKVYPTLIPTLAAPLVTSTPANYVCSVTATNPKFGTTFAPRYDFDGRWTIKNTGTKAITAADTDLKYISGTKMYKSATSYDLKSDLAVGSSVDVVADLMAPDTAGTYTTTWGMVQGSKTLCSFEVTIIVK